MNTAIDLLALLRATGAKVWVSDCQIALRTPVGTVTDKLREELSRHKAELLTLLASDWEAAATVASLLPVLTLDFETYFDDAYSLSKIPSIPEYVMDPRFRVHGLAVCHPDNQTEFRTDVEVLLEELRERYGREMEGARVVMHNAGFDTFILAHRCGQLLRHPFCTRFAAHLVHGPEQSASLRELAQAYGLAPKGHLDFMKGVRYPSTEQVRQLAEYARHDVELTRTLYERFQPALERIPAESAIIEHTVRMFVERPFDIDVEAVQAGLAELDEIVAGSLASGGFTREQISGDKAFTGLLSAALAKVGEEVPMKTGKRGLIPALSSKDEAMAGLLNHSSTEVRKLAGLRQLLGSAPQARKRLEYLVRAAQSCGKRCHFELVYHRAQHGRFAGAGGFNIQNIANPDKCRGPFQRANALCIRRAIRAQAGKVLVAADACQIEARVLAWVAGQRDLHDAFAAGQDVYSEFASQVFRCEVAKPKPGDADADLMRMLRNVGKTAILGLGYGMGVERFVDTLKSGPDGQALFDRGLLDTGICARLVYGYRDAYPAIQTLWQSGDEAFRQALQGNEVDLGSATLRKEGSSVLLRLPSGRDIVYPDAREECGIGDPRSYIDRNGCHQTFQPADDELAFGESGRLYGAKIVEHLVSGIARDILVAAILALEASGWRIVTHCHDEIVCTVPQDEAEAGAGAMVETWRQVPAWAAGLVLDAEAKTGTNLGLDVLSGN